MNLNFRVTSVGTQFIVQLVHNFLALLFVSSSFPIGIFAPAHFPKKLIIFKLLT